MTAPRPPHHVPPHHVPPRQQSGPAHRPGYSAATRHLCVAAYLDDGFRHAALREVYFQRRRLTAPSYGFDLVPVLWHCLGARSVALARDGAALGILLLTLCAAPRTGLLVLGQLAILLVGVLAWRVARESLPQSGPDRAARGGGPPITGNSILIAASLGAVFLFCGLPVLGLSVFGPALSDDVDGTIPVAGSVVLLLLVIGIPVGYSLWGQQRIEQFVPGGQPAPVPPSPRFEEVAWQQRGNTVVYSGYNPFVGSGSVIDSWGFAERLVRPDTDPTGLPGGPEREREREFEHTPFTAHELTRHVGEHLGALASDPDPERRIPELSVTDRVFLAGTEVSRLWPETDPEQLAAIIRNPTTPARHYLSCQVPAWDGELVTSVYIHVAVQGRSLYLEVTTAALPPCDDRFRIVDQVDGTGPAAYLRAAGRGILDAPQVILLAPVRLLRAAYDGLSRLASPGEDRRLASPGPAARPGQVARGFDYGARISARELAAAGRIRNHIQSQDIIKHKRLIERRVMATVLDFLEDHGVDTTQYRQRAQTVLNAGAVHTGSGNLTVTTAIGQQAPAAGAPPAGRG